METQPHRKLDWLSASLLFALIQVTAARLVTTNWAPYLYFAESLAALGTLLGLALGASRLGRRLALEMVLAYSVVLLPWQLSAAVTDESYWGRITHVGGILLVAFDQFIRQQPVKDTLFFVAFVCLVLWIISLAAGYWLIRHNNALAGILPSAVAILIIQIYDNYRAYGSWWLAVFIMIALLLAGRMYYLENQKDWLERRVFINEESWPNIFGSLLSIVLIAVMVAWSIPTSLSSLQAAADTWNKLTRPVRDRLSNAVTSLNGPYGKGGINFYGNTLGLGQNAASGDTTVFTVKVLNEPEFNSRFYWQGRVYDTYANGGWSNAPVDSLPFDPADSDLKVIGDEPRTQGLLRFTSDFPTQSLIYAPSQLVWLDRSATLQAVRSGTSIDDVLSWEAVSALPAGSQYMIRAELISPTAQQLRTAGVQYPQWVQDRYLGIPSSVEGRIRDLAKQVTQGKDTPYDKAVAITNYLRNTLQYSATLPAPPEGQDPILWVLFDYKKGFCNYYASAEVLMLRSVGIPARLAVGFAQGQHQNDEYIVRRRDAHAWPEVYFPGVGWVEFEPTVSQDPLVRPDATIRSNGIPFNPAPLKPLDDTGQPKPDHTDTTAPAASVPFAESLPGRALLIGLPLLAAACVVYLLYRYRILRYVPVLISKAIKLNDIRSPDWIENWIRWDQLEPVERYFAGINWSLQLLGHPQTIDITPSERAALLTRLLPSAVDHIRDLTAELESGLFTPRPANLARARRASLFIILHTLRLRLQKLLGMVEEGDVYSRKTES